MSGPEVAASAIVVDHGALLLVRRGRGPAAGRWSVPGGRVEHGETLRDAVVREVREETGIQVTAGELAGWVERIGDDGSHYVILDFFAAVRGDTTPAAGDDAIAARWVPVEEVARLDLVDGLLDFLRAVGSVPP